MNSETPVTSQPESIFITIGALSKATGIPVETIRTWERRYGFPNPKRTPSGHRRYAQSNVHRIRLIKEALNLGHRPASVVPLEMSELKDILNLTGQHSAPVAEVPPQDYSSVFFAIRSFNNMLLQQNLILTCSQLGLRDMVMNYMAPLIAEVGQQWAEGNLTVAQEHFFSEKMGHFISAQWRSLSQPSAEHTVLCATLDDEQHLLGLHMASTLMALNGFEVFFLGGPTPEEAIIATLKNQTCSYLALSLSPSSLRHQSANIIRSIQAKCPDIKIILGGSNAPSDIDGTLVFSRLSDFERWLISTTNAQDDTSTS